MSDLRNIAGIGKASQELLEAAGIPDVRSLAAAEAEQLAAGLKQTNRRLAVAKRAPGKAEVGKWIRAARQRTNAGSTTPPADCGGRHDTADNRSDAFPGDLFAAIECHPPGPEQAPAHEPVHQEPEPEPEYVPEPEPQYLPGNEPAQGQEYMAEYVPEPGPEYVPEPGPEYVPEPEPEYVPEYQPAPEVHEPPSTHETPGFSEQPAYPGGTSAVVPEPAGVEEVNYEATEQVREMLEGAPAAIPLPARHLIEAKVAVAEIPPALLLNRYPGDLEIRVNNRRGPRRIPRAPNLTKTRAISGAYVQISDPSPPRMQFDSSRMRSFADVAGQRAVLPAPRGGPPVVPGNSLDLLRTPLEKTNRGRNPQSRRFVRGLLHTHPWQMRFGALFSLAAIGLAAPSFLAALLLLLSDISPLHFHWVSPWLLALPCALVAVGPLYLFFGTRCRCRVCNQRQFFPRACLKNSKAHHITGLGYIIPVALHMLLFRWFRCTYCGTPVRLKK
jgi:hypothetical protein